MKRFPTFTKIYVKPALKMLSSSQVPSIIFKTLNFYFIPAVNIQAVYYWAETTSLQADSIAHMSSTDLLVVSQAAPTDQ